MKKRAISLILVLCLLLGVVPMAALGAGETPFTDVEEGKWYTESVLRANEKGYIMGVSETEFGLNTPTSRGMLVTILHRVEGEPAAEGESFSDMAEGSYYAAAVAWASANGIVKGYPDGTFAPKADLSRQDLAVIFYRYAAFKGYDVTATAELTAYPDADAVSGYAQEAMRWAVATGLVQGDGSGLSPKGTATRAQAVVILERFIETIVNATFTVTFDPNYAGSPTPMVVTVRKGETVNVPVQPTRPGHTFSDWYPGEYGGVAYDFNTPVMEDMTLYALWRSLATVEKPKEKTYTVTFETDGGSAVAPQTVKEGKKANIPDDPEKEGFAFIGWYESEGYSKPFNYDAPIQANTTLHAKWFDTVNITDSDGDGLSDELEKEFQTDLFGEDSDLDGLSDYLELNWLNYNPVSTDTDCNGVTDGEEDYDGDGLKNSLEVKCNTKAYSIDTDMDDLSDYQEIVIYHTDPLVFDTDNDGVSDGIEVKSGTDPLAFNEFFEVEASSGEIGEFRPVTASVSVAADSQGAGTLTVEEISFFDNPFIDETIPGYLGEAFNFSMEGNFEEAEITFYYDSSLGEIGDTFQPRIYYFNEHTRQFEELPNQEISEGKVVAHVTHFSTYILLNKVAFDAVWNSEILAPITDDQGNTASTIDVAFVIDVSGSMDSYNRLNTAKNALYSFLDALDTDDRAALVTFSSYAYTYSDLTGDKAAIRNYVQNLYASGQTSMYSGLSRALDLLTKQNEIYGYKMIIVLTDGSDVPSTNYKSYYSSLVNRAVDNNIIIYTVGAGSNVDTSILTQVAENTGGKYYSASMTSAIIEAFSEIQVETVDLKADENHDGIPDYYASLLNNGVLRLSTGSCALVGVLDMYSDDADWDNDGLINGEELKIVSEGSRVYVKMLSNPLDADSDHDGLSDSFEKRMGTPLLTYTILNGSIWLDNLLKNNYYVYPYVAEDQSFSSSIVGFFDWQKTDEATDILIDYFYDYANADTITENKAKISALEKKENLWRWVQSFANIANACKDISSVIDSFSESFTAPEDSGEAKQFLDELYSGKNDLNGKIYVSANANRKKLLEAINTESPTSPSFYSDLSKDLNQYVGTLENLASSAEDISEKDLSTLALTSTYALRTLSAEMSLLTSIGIHACKSFDYISLRRPLKTISQAYRQSPGTLFYVGIVLDAVDAGIEIANIYNTYGKLQANRAAYTSYIDLFYCVSKTAPEDYVRNAAEKIYLMIRDTSLQMYEKELERRSQKIVDITAFEAFFALGASYEPYLAVAHAVYQDIKITDTVIGLSANAKLKVQARTIYSISEGFKKAINQVILEKDDYNFSFDAELEAMLMDYITQLAQSRIVGLNFVKSRLMVDDIGNVVSRNISGTSREDIEQTFDEIISSTYKRSYMLGLCLSENLPYYRSKSANS